MEPHLRQSFIVMMESRLGAEVKVDSLFFSPVGRVVGRGMLVQGEREGVPFSLKLEEFDFVSKENIYMTLWEKQGDFDWMKLSYDLNFSDIEWRSELLGLREASMGSVKGVWGKDGWELEGDKTLASGNWGLSGMKKWKCGSTPRGVEVQFEEAQGSGEWGQVGLSFLFLGWDDGKKIPLWEKNLGPEDLLTSLEELRIQGMVFQKDATAYSLEQGRLQRIGDSLWQGSASGKWEGRSWNGEATLERKGDQRWAISGEIPLPVIENVISAEISGPLNARGPWKVVLKDREQNQINVISHREENNFWLGTVKASMKEWRPKDFEWEPISGELEGGFSWNPELSEVRFKGGLENLSGGPGRTRDGKASFSGQLNLKQKFLNLEQFEISEAEEWSGSLSAGVRLSPLSPDSLDVALKNFPLGRYSPKADGKLGVSGSLKKGVLNVRVSSPRLYPNKNPLQFMEDFKVEVQCDSKGVNYQQTFVQDSQSRLIDVKVLVDELLDDPFKMRQGRLEHLKARAGLFDLNLVSEVPVRINLEGAQVPQFHLDDGNLRLRDIQGHAFIPFLTPSKLLVEAQGRLDLAKMPQLGETRVEGSVDVFDARWDKGWGLRNLKARIKGRKISIKPESVFDEIEVSDVEGRLENSTVILDRVVGNTADGGKVEANGEYNFGNPNIDLNFKASDLSFRSSDYQLIYDLENLKLKGPPLSLAITGNLLAHEFLYSGDFSMMGSEEGERPSLPMHTAATRLVGHRLALDVRSEKALAIKNNSLDLTFRIQDLLIHGPLSELKWKGLARSTSRDENRISLPLQWLDVSFKANELSLVFDDQKDWNPRAHLQAETEIEDVKVFLNYDDRLDALSKGEFNLTSSPAYSRQEILSMLSSGSKPTREIFDDGGGATELEDSGPSLTLFKSRPRSNQSQQFSYSASLRSDSQEEEFFELRVYYRLSEHLDIELSQDGGEGAFAGLRYSKQADSLKALIRKDDLLDRPNKEERLPIHWEFEGIPIGSGLSSKLKAALSRVEGLLDAHQLDQARLIMKETINDVLAKEGFLDARYTVLGYERRVRTLPGRGKASTRRFEFGRMRISFECGSSYRLDNVEIIGWPTLVPLPDDPWLKRRHMRNPLIQSERLASFQRALLNTLSDRGYALAEVISLRVSPQFKEEGKTLLDGLTEFPVRSSSEESQGWKGDIPVTLKIEVDPGLRQVMVQHFIEGLQTLTHEEAMKIMSAEDGDIYRENRILKYPGKLLNWYRREGFFDTQVEIRRILRSRRYPRLSLHMTVKEGKQWVLGDIHVTGLRFSDDEYLLEVSGLEMGAQANPIVLEEALRKIGKLPHVLNLSYRWGDLENGKRDLFLEVEEHALWRFSARLGYESGDGEQLSFRLQRMNLFGRGEEGGLETDFSPEEQKHVLRYRRDSPWLQAWDEQWTLGLRDREISQQSLENTTWLASFSLLDSDEMNIRSWGVSYREDRNLQGEAPSVRITWVNDRYPVTAPRRPDKGWSWKLRQQGVAYFDRNRYALIGEGRLAYGFKFGGSIMVPWVRAGQAWPIGPKSPLPLADRFFLGGAGSLRGFERDEITGKNQEGGESLLSYGTELFYPVLDWIDGSLFYEWGRVFDGYHYDEGGVRGHAIGMGLVFRTPVGPIEGFFAHPLGIRSTGRVGFQLGTIF